MPESRSPRQTTWMRALRAGLGALCVALLVGAVWSQRDALTHALEQLDATSVAIAFGFVLIGLMANMMSWRAVLSGLGSTLSVPTSARVFLLAQLGKYLPGSIWPLVAQTELARDHGVPRARSALAGVVALMLGLVVGVAVAIACLLPIEGTDSSWWPAAGLLVVPILVLLHPRVLDRVLRAALRLARQPEPSTTLGSSALLQASAWSVAMWLALGAHVWVLLRDLGGEADHAFLLSVGSYAAAWSAGLLVVVAPAGAGAREAALVLALTPALGRPAALALAVTSRALTLIGDGVCALGAILVGRGADARQALLENGTQEAK